MSGPDQRHYIYQKYHTMALVYSERSKHEACLCVVLYVYVEMRGSGDVLDTFGSSDEVLAS